MHKGFERVKLGEIAYFEMGNSPRSKYVDETPPGVPFLQGNAEFGRRSPNHDRYCFEPSKVSQEGDILISVRAPVGDVNVSDRRYCIGRGLAAIRFHNVGQQFGWHLMNFFAPKLDKYAQGSTFRAVNKAHLEDLEVIIPKGSDEQRRIADVLDTVDAAIQETDAVVEKQEQVKTGLLQDLLTRGLDADGRLRDPEREPAAFRETEYGPLPRTWEMKPLNDFSANGSDTFGNGPSGSNLLTSEMTHEGVPVVYIADIEEGRYRRETDRHVTPEKAQELSGFDVRKGDVIMSKVGDPPCDAAPYLRDQFAIMTQDVIRIRPAEDVDTQFLTDLLNSKVGRKAVEGIAVQGTRKRVSLTDLKAVQLPKPPHEEQLRIGKVVATKRQEMEEERSYRDKLRHLKRGLMQDLLTGRVRVPEAEARVDEVVV